MSLGSITICNLSELVWIQDLLNFVKWTHNILDKTRWLPVGCFILLDRLIPQTAKTGNSFCLVPIDKLLHDNHRYFIFQIETCVYIMAGRIGWHNPFVQLGSCYMFNVLAFCPGGQNIWHNKRFVHQLWTDIKCSKWQIYHKFQNEIKYTPFGPKTTNCIYKHHGLHGWTPYIRQNPKGPRYKTFVWKH